MDEFTYVCMCVYVHVEMYGCMHVHVDGWVDKFTYVCMRVHACRNVRVYACAWGCMNG